MHKSHSVVLVLLLLAWSIPAHGFELQSRFATIEYQHPEDLGRYNKALRNSFGLGFGGGNSLSIESETLKRLDDYAVRVQSILDMHPPGFRYHVRLLADKREVNNQYQTEYQSKPGFIAYFSPKSDTIYLSLNDLEKTVLVHELAHAVIHHYFNKAPPVKIHELLAQYVEREF
jgi:hypothetical protein